MRKLALLMLTAAALPACCAGVRAQFPTMQEMVFHLENETVALDALVSSDGDQIEKGDPAAEDGTLKAYCTGVWVSQDTILTAEHCVDDIGKPKVEKKNRAAQLLESLGLSVDVEEAIPWTPVGQPVMFSVHGDVTPDKHQYHDGKVIAVDMYNDLALIASETAPPEHPVAKLAQGPILDGTPLHIVGHPTGLWWTYVHGYVAAHRPAMVDDDDKPKEVHDLLQVSAPIFFGNSGGPAFNEDGELVGLADEIRRNVPEVAFYVHRDVLKYFLEKNGIDVSNRQ